MVTILRAMDTRTRISLRVAGALGFLGVALGAFGAHGLADLLARNERLDTWHTAVLYHLIHAVALMALAAAGRVRPLTFWSWLIGILLFSGSLYVLSVTNIKALGAITPFGGVAFLIGWGSVCLRPKGGSENEI